HSILQLMCLCSFFFLTHVNHRDLHFFPTRRSSDLHNLMPIDFEKQNLVDVIKSFCEECTTDNRPVNFQTNVEKINLDKDRSMVRSEEHTSELQSRENLVCRLLLEKKNKLKNKKQQL